MKETIQIGCLGECGGTYIEWFRLSGCFVYRVDSSAGIQLGQV